MLWRNRNGSHTMDPCLSKEANLLWQEKVCRQASQATVSRQTCLICEKQDFQDTVKGQRERERETERETGAERKWQGADIAMLETFCVWGVSVFHAAVVHDLAHPRHGPHELFDSLFCFLVASLSLLFWLGPVRCLALQQLHNKFVTFTLTIAFPCSSNLRFCLRLSHGSPFIENKRFN